MALLPARRNGTLSRPGPQAPTRWDPFAEFEYRVLLPGQAEADKVTAALADGVLTVTVPTTEAGKPRRIHITG